MNDEQLIQLLQDKTPEELSLAEIDLLRRRLAASDSLRQALFEQLEMEQYLAEALGRVNVSVDHIAERPRRATGQGPHPVLLAVVVVLSLGMIGFISLVIIAAMRGPEAKPVAVVEDDSPPDGESPPIVDDFRTDVAKPPIVDEPEEEPEVLSVDETPNNPPPADPPTEEKEPPPLMPWDVDLAAPPQRFDQTWYVDFDTDKHVPAKEEIETWFSVVPGQTSKFYEETISNIPNGAFQGLVRLKAPLGAGTALRFSTSKADQLRIHLYREGQGVSIYANTRHGDSDRWATYQVTRDGDKPKPVSYQLTNTDESRDENSDARYGPTLLLRWHDGEIVLSRGDVELARAAMPDGPPEEVFFEGQAAFRGIEMLRLTDPPAPAHAWVETYPVINKKAAELTWAGDLSEKSVFERRDDGSIHLASDNIDQFIWMATPLPTARVHFIEVELQDVQPGAQIYLGPPAIVAADGKVEQLAGRPHNPTLTFATNDSDKRLAVEWNTRDDSRKVVYINAPQEKTVPYAGENTWVRFLVAAGRVRCWISADGEYWALLNWGNDGFSGPLTHLGIACSKNAPKAQLTVRQIRFRELLLNGLVDVALLDRAQTQEPTLNYAQWLVAVSQSQPGDVERDQWRIANAIRQLAIGGDKETAQALLAMLVASQQSAQAVPAEQLALLREVALLANKYVKLPSGATFDLTEHYWDVGRQLAATGSERPFSAVRHAMMTDLPQARSPFRSYNPELIRLELIRLAYAGDWSKISAVVEQLVFFGGSKYETTAPLAPWLAILAARHQPRTVGDGVERLPSDWQSPLVEQYSKDAYNVMAEFHAALDSESFDDASRMIADLDPYAVSGLVPSSRDADLLVSAATAIGSALARDQKLSQIMNSEFAPLGELRVKQASAAGDEAAVRLATVQFQGTPAAGLAHRWLGDRALAAGQFVPAIAQYRRAIEQVGVIERCEIELRIRLAAAMLGSDLGKPATATVRFGEVSMSADEFEQMIAEMRATHVALSGSLQVHNVVDDEDVVAPIPIGFQVHRRGRLDGEPGDSPNRLNSVVRENEVPWLERQLGIAVDGEIAYVSNRFHIAAYNLANNGARLWQSKAPPNRGNAHDWSMTSMRPLVVGDQVFSRQLTKYGPLLLCLNRADGKQFWIQEPPKEEAVLSDPMLAEGKLFALTLLKTPRGEDQLRLCSYALGTGDVIETHDLLNIRDSWQQQKICRATQLPDGLVATLGGLVINVGFDGDVRWVRRQLTLPASQEPNWITQRFDRPLVSDNRVIVATPGVRTIACLELDSGRLLWRQILPNVDRMVGMVDGNVIIHTDDSYAALDLVTGEQRWATEIANPYDAELCGGEHGMLIGHQITSPTDPNRRCPELIWLNGTTGEITARTALPDLNQDKPRFGPLVRDGESLWTFFANGPDDPHRDLIQLEPQKDVKVAVTGEVLAPTSDAWLRHTRAEHRDAIEKVFPQWHLLSSASRDGFGFVADIHNEKEVVALPTDGGSPIVLAREITVPKTGKPRLRLRIGNDPNHHWRLTVRMGEKVLAEREIDWKKKPEIWKDQTISLAPVAGQTGWLTVEAQFIANGDHSRTYWKRLDVQF